MSSEVLQLDKLDIGNSVRILNRLNRKQQRGQKKEDGNFTDKIIMIVSQTSEKRLVIEFHDGNLWVGYQKRKRMEFTNDFDPKWENCQKCGYLQFDVADRVRELARRLHNFIVSLPNEGEEQQQQEQICIGDQGRE